MRRALDFLCKTAAAKPRERKLGRKPGDVLTRTVIAGRSYDHVRTKRTDETEIHPTNMHRHLGSVHKEGEVYAARTPSGRKLGRHKRWHEAARAVVTQEEERDDAGADDVDDPNSPTGMDDTP